MTLPQQLHDEPAVASPQAKYAAPPRLSIAHLLLWMATTALVVALFPADWMRKLDSSTPLDQESFRQQMERRQTVEKVGAALVAPFYGAGLAAVVVATLRAVRREPGFPAAPGHWLLLHVGLGFLAFADAYHKSRGSRYVKFELLNPEFDPVSLLLFLVFVAQLIVALGAAVQPQPWRWRLAFGIYLGGVAALIGGMLLGWQGLANEFWLGLAGIVAANGAAFAIFAAARDLFRRERYDLFHWLGVIVLIAVAAHPILAGLATRLALRV